MMTEPTPDVRHPAEGKAVGINPEKVLAAHAALLQQPAWAERVLFHHDVGREGSVTHLWTAPMPTIPTSEACTDVLVVQACQVRFLTLLAGGVVLEEPEAASVHCDAGDLWLSPSDARALAAALVACADRLDGVA